MIVLTGARGMNGNGRSGMEALVAYMYNRVYVSQARLAALSTRGEHVVLDYVGHGIPTEAPGVVVEAVRKVWTESHVRSE